MLPGKRPVYIKQIMDHPELQILLDKYITGDLTPAEKARLAELAGQPVQILFCLISSCI